MSNAKEWVREAYGAVARQESSCCAPSCCGSKPEAPEAFIVHSNKIGEVLGYTQEDLTTVPEGSNLGLGCGNPVALAELREGETVVDLGSGAGFDCFLASSRVGPTGKVIGVDMTPEMIEKARGNATKGDYTNVDFRLGEIEALPLEDASVDTVISNCVLNLVPCKAKAFGEIYRILKPGGKLAVSDIVLSRDLPETLKNDPAVYSSCIGGAIRKEQYFHLLAETGFVEVEVVDQVDAGELLNCTPGPVSDILRQASIETLSGWAWSVKLKAWKPQ